MTKKVQITMIGLGLLLGTLVAFGQPTVTQMSVQKEVSYKTSTVKIFAVDCGVVVDSLSPLDWVYLQAKPPLIRFSKFSIKNNWLTITYSYPQMPRYERDYEFETGMSVTDKWGTRLYYHNGEEYYKQENEEENKDYLLETEEIENYGFYNGLFDVSVDAVYNQFQMQGIPVYRWGQKLLAIQTLTEDDTTELRLELEMDFNQLYLERRTFKNNVHVFTEHAEYQKIAGGKIIPTQRKRVHYSELPSETPYQITEIETYLSYQVTKDNGRVLVDWQEIPQETSEFEQDTIEQYQPTVPASLTVQVIPNPAHEDIRLIFPVPINATMEVKITDIMGVVFTDYTKYITGNELFINIQNLPAGMYYITCVCSDGTVTAHFMKN